MRITCADWRGSRVVLGVSSEEYEGVQGIMGDYGGPWGSVEGGR